MMERQMTKTYSRRAPVTTYKSSAALVPSFPNPATHVRESRLNEKTLVVDTFEDTFDRIATGVIVRSPKKYTNSNGSIDTSDEFFKRPSRAEEEERKEMDDKFWEQKDLKLRNNAEKTRQRNKRDVPNKSTEVKRKRLIDDISDDSDDSETIQSAKIPKFKKPKQTKKVVKTNKASPAKEKTQEANFVGENRLANIEDSQVNSTIRVNDSSFGFIDELQMSKDICNLQQRKFLYDCPTSTPRDHKQKLIVNMQNLSPIMLNKELLSVADIEPISKAKHVLRESNLNEVSSQMSSQESNEVLIPKSVLVESNISSNNHKSSSFKFTPKRKERSETEDDDHAVKENRDENNSSMHDLLGFNASTENNKNKQENDIKQVTSVLQSNSKTKFLNATPMMKNQIHNTISSFVESPLLFDDTDIKRSQQGKECSVVSNNASNTPEELNENSVKKSDTEKKNSAAFRNLNEELDNTQSEHFDESSFSPHEWSNDYNSSYEYFSDKNKSVINRFEGEGEESKLKSSFKDNQFDTNNTCLSKKLSKESMHNKNASYHQQSSGNSELQRVNNEAEIIDILNPRNESNSFIIPNKSNDDKSKISETENVINENNENVIHRIDDIGSNSNSFELRVESNSSSTKGDSPISKDQKTSNISKFTESIANQSEDQITDIPVQSNEIYAVDEKIEENLMNRKSQVDECSRPTISNTINERAESIQNYKVDERLNGQNLVICLTRLSPDIYKSSPVTKTSKMKQQIKAKSFKKGKFSRRKIKKIVPNENNNIENLDDQKVLNHSQKLNNKSLETRALLLSGRITKKKSKKGVLKKTTKSSKQKKENCKSYAMDIVKNGILHKESGSEGNEDKYKKLCQVFKIKESHVLIPKLRDLNMENKSSSSASQTIKRKSRKSKSIKKHKDKNKSKNESIIKSAQDSIVNLVAERDTSIKNHSNTSVEQKAITAYEQNNFENKNEINASFNGQELSDILLKLNDPIKITMRRNPYKKSERLLAAISEDLVEQPSCIGEEEENENDDNNIESRKSNKNLAIECSMEESEVNKSAEDQTHPIFLKPGKSWARSLSIINHFHTGQNLEQLAAGRGKSWRHSVQTILNMQPEVNTQVVAKKSSEDKDEHSHYFNMPVVQPQESNRVSSITTSPPRFSRFSIRIIPDGKRSTLTNEFTHSRDSSSIYHRTRKTSLARKTSLKIRRETLIETEEDLIRSAKDIILKRCKQTTYLQFNECFPDSYIDNCRKIGEGVYGEVFLYQSKTEKSVIKIIPIEGDELVNCEPQKKFHEILSEIIISEELHKLRFENQYNTNGFVGVNRIMCVIGKYPEKLIELWNAYDEEKNSENDSPSMFNENQLYIILELAHGGQDLEAYVFQNASESYSIFLQTAFTLAVAEQSLEFEHRDLHWGNILISKSDESESRYKLGSEEISLSTKGVKVSVIDFTLSRMSYQGCKIFNDLAADPTLFTAQGEYQFDIYRMMRDSVSNDWQQFNPYTNVLWLDYTLDKMITAARYKRKTSKIHKSAIEEMKNLRKEILNYKSAFEFVSKCEIIIIATKT